jgi:iron only hydrogenase large subunit-like protein
MDDQKPKDIIKSGQSLVAMLAPSFPIVFNPKTIVGQLKRAGFAEVVEVSMGAKKTNEEVLAKLNENVENRVITNPCPNIVRMIRSKFPEAINYLPISVDSPMAATAKLVKDKFPESRPVFIGPCLVKRLEAAEDRPELNILCVTFKDVQQLLIDLNIGEEIDDEKNTFSMVEENTRLYPVSGGLTQSSGARDLLSEDDIGVVSGAKNAMEAIQRFLDSDHIRLLDILFCEGGCINGPGIVSPLTMEQRRKKITDYWGNK